MKTNQGKYLKLTVNKILVIGMPRCGAHSLGQYLTKKYPNKTVITDEYTFLSDETIRESKIDKALKESEVYIICRRDFEHWEESFTALIGKPPNESQADFIKRMRKFCKPKVVWLEDYKHKEGFPHLNKRNFNTHPKKIRQINELAYVHINRKNYE